MSKIKPIIFKPEMVRAILDGRKKQTRRLDFRFKSGDILWVRETWSMPRAGRLPNGEDMVYYKADMVNDQIWKGFWNPSIFMPKWACRLFLFVERTSIEPLQSISEFDAQKEGVEADPETGSYVDSFMFLWDKINKKRAPWDQNPYVQAVTFHICPKPIQWEFND